MAVLFVKLPRSLTDLQPTKDNPLFGSREEDVVFGDQSLVK